MRAGVSHFCFHLSAVTVAAKSNSVPAVNGLLNGPSRRFSEGRELFVLASLVIESWARTFKEELPAKTEQLREQFPIQVNAK